MKRVYLQQRPHPSSAMMLFLLRVVVRSVKVESGNEMNYLITSAGLFMAQYIKNAHTVQPLMVIFNMQMSN